MAVDKALLESCIAEAAGDDAEMATFLRDRYSKNEASAARFVAGFTRSSDYTKKTQALADERKQLGDVSSQLDAARKALAAADTEKNKIMQELAGQRISTAKARELMKLLQEKYQLTDEDLPGMSELIETRKQGVPVDNTPDLDTRLAAFKADILKEAENRFAGQMIPELGAMASLPIIWGEIQREHQELTGKSLSYAEQQEILKVAREGKSGGLRDVWEAKFNIAGDSGLRMQKRLEAERVKWSEERDKAEADARSKAALEVVTGPKPTDFADGGVGISSAFKTRFKQFEMDPEKPAVAAGDGVPTLQVAPGQHVRQAGAGRVPASQRAAQKFLERGGSAGYGRKAS